MEAASARSSSQRPGLIQFVLASGKHLVVRTARNVKGNLPFMLLYLGCVIVLLRALSGAGYDPSADPSNASATPRSPRRASPLFSFKNVRDVPHAISYRYLNPRPQTERSFFDGIGSFFSSPGAPAAKEERVPQPARAQEAEEEDALGMLIFGEATGTPGSSAPARGAEEVKASPALDAEKKTPLQEESVISNHPAASDDSNPALTSTPGST